MSLRRIAAAVSNFFSRTEDDFPAAMRATDPPPGVLPEDFFFLDQVQEDAGQAGEPKSPAKIPSEFVTKKSLRSLPGSVVAVSVIWYTAKTLAPPWGASPWVPLVASLLVGALITLPTVFDPRFGFTTWEKVEGIAIGFINSLVIFAATIGVPVAARVISQ